MRNIDPATVHSFGSEWGAYQQSENVLSDSDRAAQFDAYFRLFPWATLPSNAVGADVGCGSGRWALLVAPRVKHLYAIDPAPEAIAVAQRNLSALPNVSVIRAEANLMPIPDGSLDFAYCLGVLHHVPDTNAALRAIVSKLKPGAPLLLYLYYAFDNRPAWFREIWRTTNFGRLLISRLPFTAKRIITNIIAASIYWPLARSAWVLERLGLLPESWPLSYYRNRGFYVMRTDAYDRFCTPLEKRFSRNEIEAMMIGAGLSGVIFSEASPFWTSVGRRRIPS